MVSGCFINWSKGYIQYKTITKLWLKRNLIVKTVRCEKKQRPGQNHLSDGFGGGIRNGARDGSRTRDIWRRQGMHSIV